MSCRVCGRDCFGSICAYCKGERPQPLKPCVECRAMVPEHQESPYPGHKPGCRLVRAWMGELETQVLEVRVPGWGMIRHLKVWRYDGKDGITWDRLQEVKNECLGPDVRAIEVYPPQDELVNSTPMRHLWEVPDGVVIPSLFERG